MELDISKFKIYLNNDKSKIKYLTYDDISSNTHRFSPRSGNGWVFTLQEGGSLYESIYSFNLSQIDLIKRILEFLHKFDKLSLKILFT